MKKAEVIVKRMDAEAALPLRLASPPTANELTDFFGHFGGGETQSPEGTTDMHHLLESLLRATHQGVGIASEQANIAREQLDLTRQHIQVSTQQLCEQRMTNEISRDVSQAIQTLNTICLTNGNRLPIYNGTTAPSYNSQMLYQEASTPMADLNVQELNDPSSIGQFIGSGLQQEHLSGIPDTDPLSMGGMTLDQPLAIGDVDTGTARDERIDVGQAQDGDHDGQFIEVKAPTGSAASSQDSEDEDSNDHLPKIKCHNFDFTTIVETIHNMQDRGLLRPAGPSESITFPNLVKSMKALMPTRTGEKSLLQSMSVFINYILDHPGCLDAFAIKDDSACRSMKVKRNKSRTEYKIMGYKLRSAR